MPGFRPGTPRDRVGSQVGRRWAARCYTYGRDGPVPLRSAGSSGRRSAADRRRTLRRDRRHDPAARRALAQHALHDARRRGLRPADRQRQRTGGGDRLSRPGTRPHRARGTGAAGPADAGRPQRAARAQCRARRSQPPRAAWRRILPGITFTDDQIVSLPSLWAIGELLGRRRRCAASASTIRRRGGSCRGTSPTGSSSTTRSTRRSPTTPAS